MGGTTERVVVREPDNSAIELLTEQITAQNQEREEMQVRHEEQLRVMHEQQRERDEEQRRALRELREQQRREFEAQERRRENAEKLLRETMVEQQKRNDEKLRFMQVDALKKELRDATDHLRSLERPYKHQLAKVMQATRDVALMQKQVDTEEEYLQNKFQAEIDDTEMMRIVLYGPTGHGKSTLANRISGDTSRKANKGPCKVSGSVHSETKGIQKVVAKGNHLPRPLSVTDQPGTGDTDGQDRLHANGLVKYLRGIGHLNAVVLVRSLNTPRIDKPYQDMLHSLQEMLGRGIWKHAMVALTGVDRPEQMEDFAEYTQQFRGVVRRLLQLRESDAMLPMVPIANFGDYKKGIATLVKVCERFGKFECKHLRSPLDGLKGRLGIAKRQLAAETRDLQGSEDIVKQVEQRVRSLNHEIKRKDPSFTAVVVRSFLVDPSDQKQSGKAVTAQATQATRLGSANAGTTPLAMPAPMPWTCTACTMVNQATNKSCLVCGLEKGHGARALEEMFGGLAPPSEAPETKENASEREAGETRRAMLTERGAWQVGGEVSSVAPDDDEEGGMNKVTKGATRKCTFCDTVARGTETQCVVCSSAVQ